MNKDCQTCGHKEYEHLDKIWRCSMCDCEKFVAGIEPKPQEEDYGIKVQCEVCDAIFNTDEEYTNHRAEHDKASTPTSRKVELATPEQFARGYDTYRNGKFETHQYEVAWRDGAGNYGVYVPDTEAPQPEPEKPKAKRCATCGLDIIDCPYDFLHPAEPEHPDELTRRKVGDKFEINGEEYEVAMVEELPDEPDNELREILARYIGSPLPTGLRNPEAFDLMQRHGQQMIDEAHAAITAHYNARFEAALGKPETMPKRKLAQSEGTYKLGARELAIANAIKRQARKRWEAK